MGFSHEAYVAYGVRVPVGPYVSDDAGLYPSEQVDQALSVPTVRAFCPDVGHLEAEGVLAARLAWPDRIELRGDVKLSSPASRATASAD